MDRVTAGPGRIDPAFWRDRRVFLTGHTGFKGSWLSSWLTGLGAQVRGYSLPPPTVPSLFDAAGLQPEVDHVVGDVNDLPALRRALAEWQPAAVFHLAAQPLVRESYRDPVLTFTTNVLGTVHLLEAVRDCASVRAVVCVTTDKCYDNREWPWGYRESDMLGGHDPYSASKAAAEIAAAAYRRSYFEGERPATALATARAGNVIGGGDWSADRLVADAARAFSAGAFLEVRRPLATRPWQHVLEPLSGYLALAQAGTSAPLEFSGAWNFGPVDDDVVTVSALLDGLVAHWGGHARWRVAGGGEGPHEATQLKLDISKARDRLGWTPRWRLAEALRRTARWYRAFYEGAGARALRELMAADIHDYCPS